MSIHGSYESAPSTVLLATHCALCGRPLRDAVSVEMGVGPDCREKHGYGKQCGKPNFLVAAVSATTAFGKLPEALGDAFSRQDAHAAANILVHHVAVMQLGDATPFLTAAISALGFERLAARLAERIASTSAVRVTREGELLVVSAPYNAGFNELVRRVPGARWDRERKVRTVPSWSRQALWAAIRASFDPGTLVIGDRVIVLGADQVG